MTALQEDKLNPVVIIIINALFIVGSILCFNTWFPPVLESSVKSWNLKRVLESPGILLKFWKSPGKILEFFLWSNSPKERSLSKYQQFPGFLCMLYLAVHWLTAVISIWDILDAIINVYIFSALNWVTIFKFVIKSLILQLWNCMSNPSATVFSLIHHPLVHVFT